MKLIDVIVPVKNEEKNIEGMVLAIDAAFKSNKQSYGIIFSVDESTDDTEAQITKFQKDYPIKLHNKIGKGGKGYSILEAIDLTDAPYVAFVDGDLQYPPEHLAEMVVRLAEDPKLGVVVANRKDFHVGFIRKFISRTNKLIVGKWLLGIDADIQSGLKAFKREIAVHINKEIVTAWTFDIPLLKTAVEMGYEIGEIDIEFKEREHGASKVGIIKTSWTVFVCAFKAKFGKKKMYDLDTADEFDNGIKYNKKAYTPHTKLHHSRTALYTLVNWQKVALWFIGGFALMAILFYPLETIILLVGILSVIYFIDVLFNIYVILKSLHFPPELEFTDNLIKQVKNDNLPMYTVLCPLYKEAEVLPDFVENMSNLDWPHEKLEVLLLLEENDPETRLAAENMDLPDFIKVCVVPHSMPKTKPKACNYGLQRATGEFIVIYDAEDKPEPDQLKKAYLGFQYEKENTVCIQAKLNYYNTYSNLLTRLFTAEYSLWFDVILPGLQSISTTIPLGGTSNHFKTEKLRALHGWDPFNVTEDCDLGARLFKEGYKTAIIDSTTYEEANSDTMNWIRQRSRWIKGYMQTYFVHMREPVTFFRQHGWHALLFQLVIGLRIYFILINPFLWLATISYFVFYDQVGVFIESLYPSYIFYMAVFSLVFGNFIYLYNYMIGCVKRSQWSVVKFVFLIPVYWALMFLAACMAFYQLIMKPHHWEKTKHGLHLAKKPVTVPVEAVVISASNNNVQFSKK